MSERVISDPTSAGWELDPSTGYWMWAAEGGSGGSIQDGDTEGQITTWDGTEWTPDSSLTIDADGNVNITGKLFVNGQEVTGGGGDSFWVEESPGVIKYTGTAKAADVVATG